MNKLNQIQEKLNEIMMNNFVISETNILYLYHYTTLYNARSIIESGQFYISDSFKTNDPREIIHIKNIMEEIIDENVEYQIYKEALFSFFDTTCNLIKNKSFILCFSLDNKSPKLWKEYSKQGGVCLRFNAESLIPNGYDESTGQHRFFEDKNGKVIKILTKNLNHKVYYDKVHIKSKIKEYLSLTFECLKLISIDAIENDPELVSNYKDEFDLLNDIFTDIFLYSCFSKENEWKSEIEYRMLYLIYNEKILGEIVHHRKSFDGKKVIDFLKLNLKCNNTFSLNRVFVKQKKYLKTARRELKRVIDNEIKIKTI